MRGANKLLRLETSRFCGSISSQIKNFIFTESIETAKLIAQR